MFLWYPNYAEPGYHYEHRKYRRYNLKQLHATVPRCRFQKRGPLAIDCFSMMLLETELEADGLYEDIMGQENARGESIAGSAANKFTKAEPTELKASLIEIAECYLSLGQFLSRFFCGGKLKTFRKNPKPVSSFLGLIEKNPIKVSKDQIEHSV